MRRPAAVLCSLALLPVAPAALAQAPPAHAGGAATAPAATAAAKKKPKKCRKGYERKRVKVGKRRVVRCVKKRKPGRTTPAVPAPGTAPAPAPAAPATPTPEQAAATWRSLVAGSSFTYATYSATNGGSSKTVFGFCGDGASFRYYHELVGSVYNEAKTRTGTYTLSRAVAGTDGAGQFVDGLIDYQSDIEERPAGQAVVRVYPALPGKAYLNTGDGVTEYSRAPGAAGC